MIQLDPEVWAKRIMGSILIPLAVLVGAQAAQCYSVGKNQTSLLFYNFNFCLASDPAWIFILCKTA